MCIYRLLCAFLHACARWFQHQPLQRPSIETPNLNLWAPHSHAFAFTIVLPFWERNAEALKKNIICVWKKNIIYVCVAVWQCLVRELCYKLTWSNLTPAARICSPWSYPAALPSFTHCSRISRAEGIFLLSLKSLLGGGTALVHWAKVGGTHTVLPLIPQALVRKLKQPGSRRSQWPSSW